MKGIILAGGNGTRMYPLTLACCKQLLPVYDKPMIFYPLSVLMLARIGEILVISTPSTTPSLRDLFGDGSHLGLDIGYAVQDEPRGIADALLIGADHIAGDDCALILGDNIFHGARFTDMLAASRAANHGCTLFSYPVTDPERYAVAELGSAGELLSIVEKPLHPRSENAITGLYLYDREVVEIARGIRPSSRGELEITDVNRAYLDAGRARLVELGRGFTWLDAGTPESLLEAAEYVRTLENRQGISVACIEEIALRMGFIDAEQCFRLGSELGASNYGRYVMEVAAEISAAH
ncbi:glucose-1-phosphate thymidylyltransferase [Actinomadura sp. KC06]|uniref:glucose-1-phosphate thymidylyltransferase RfbA n=1 Tax=Actinomadura sp. KC06 TaxID=2530369 RepID=UPI0010432046|nr:glucose-1-phosphate thymidylyltransferase RfbA [Actinomadura sp. KC06]TDD37558.1 glucose-1-phosphate thymidylyltransferase [Actinomadura sp. KC06]